MKLLEIITLRCAGKLAKAAVEECRQQIVRCCHTTKPKAVRLYRQATMEHELSIHLLWEGTPTTMRKSDVGRSLAYTIGKYGLIHHSLWIGDEVEGHPTADTQGAGLP